MPVSVCDCVCEMLFMSDINVCVSRYFNLCLNLSVCGLICVLCVVCPCVRFNVSIFAVYIKIIVCLSV